MLGDGTILNKEQVDIADQPNTRLFIIDKQSLLNRQWSTAHWQNRKYETSLNISTT